MLSQTFGAHVDLVNLAMDYRQVAMADIAAAPNPAVRVLRFPRCRGCTCGRLAGASFEKNARRCHERAQGNAARTQNEKIRVRMFTQCRGHHDQSDACYERSDTDQPVANS